jgi:hypothetical protein
MTRVSHDSCALGGRTAAPTEPKKISFLNSSPFDGVASFKKGKPSNTILGSDRLEKACHVGLGGRGRLRAAPFDETLNDQKHNVWSSMH